MKPYKELEQFVINGYYDSERFKTEAPVEYYNDETDSIILRYPESSDNYGDNYEVKAVDYLKDYLASKSEHYFRSITHADEISKASLIHSEERLRLLINRVNGNNSEEILYAETLQKKVEDIKRYRHMLYGSEEAEKNTKLKIGTNLTVPQLGYLFNIMKEICFNNKQSKAEYMALIASIFTSINADEISIKSIKNKAESPNQKDMEIIHSILIKLREKVEDDKRII